MVEAPGRTKDPSGSGSPSLLSGVTRSPSRRLGALLILLTLAFKVLPNRVGMVAAVPIVETPLAVPVNGVCPTLGTVPGVTVLLVISTGMLTMACALLRNRSGQRRLR